MFKTSLETAREKKKTFKTGKARNKKNNGRTNAKMEDKERGEGRKEESGGGGQKEQKPCHKLRIADLSSERDATMSS